MRATFHLVPVDVWTTADPSAPYAAASLGSEGFIHCTDGAEALIATANRHYRDDVRSFLAMTVDLDALSATWRIDDPAGIYPHIFGPIERNAILAVVPIRRDPDGRFTGLDAAG